MALENIWVVDFTTIWAGPLVTKMLADFGAEVIKVESIQYPDRQRYSHPPRGEAGEKPYNRGGYFHQFNRNKYGITLDLSQSRGKEVFLRLIKKADVFVENYAPRVIKNLGLSYEELIKVKTDLIMLSLHGYGMSGPYSNIPAFGFSIEGLSGFSSLTGYGNGVPVPSGIPLPDPIAALHGAFAILAALDNRRKTSKGQFIDLSIHDTLGCVMEEAILPCIMNGREPCQLGDRHPYIAVHGCYRCKGDDSWVAMAVASDQEWLNLCKVIGNPALNSERFSDRFSRWQNREELHQLIEEWTIQHDRFEIMKILQEAGIAAGAVLNSQDILNEPHLKERDYFVR